MTAYPARQISVSIDRPADAVYRFAANPENLPQWAAGLSRASLVRDGDEWIAQSPMGTVKIRFAEDNAFGVIDHDVTLPSGEINHNPLRVVKNGTGSEIIFTLFRLPRMTDEDFEKDAAMVKQDLSRLKAILEAGENSL